MVPVKLTKGKLDTIRGKILSTTIVQTAEKAIEEENENIAERLDWSDITFSNTYTEDLVEFEETLSELKASKCSGREFVTSNDKGIILGIYKTSYIAGLMRIYQTTLLYFSMPDGVIKSFTINSNETCSLNIESVKEDDTTPTEILVDVDNFNIPMIIDGQDIGPRYTSLYQTLSSLMQTDNSETRQNVITYINNNVLLGLISTDYEKKPFITLKPINIRIDVEEEGDEPVFLMSFIYDNPADGDFESNDWTGTSNVLYITISLIPAEMECEIKYIPVGRSQTASVILLH